MHGENSRGVPNGVNEASLVAKETIALRARAHIFGKPE